MEQRPFSPGRTKRAPRGAVKRLEREATVAAADHPETAALGKRNSTLRASLDMAAVLREAAGSARARRRALRSDHQRRTRFGPVGPGAVTVAAATVDWFP